VTFGRVGSIAWLGDCLFFLDSELIRADRASKQRPNLLTRKKLFDRPPAPIRFVGVGTGRLVYSPGKYGGRREAERVDSTIGENTDRASPLRYASRGSRTCRLPVHLLNGSE
jgi:hypothetical protein